jgi:hypothetical protein
VNQALLLASCSVLALAPAPAAGGVGAERPRVQLSVSPASVAVAGAGARRIRVRNAGAEALIVDVTRRPAARPWLHVVPSRLRLRSGATATLMLRITPPRRAEPGDHRALVLLTTSRLRGGRVNVHLRLGVRVSMRVPGPILRHVTVDGLRVVRRLLFVSVVNRGNVSIPLRQHLTATLVRGRRRLARLRPRGNPVLAPGARAIVTLRYRGGAHGPVTVVVRVRLGADAVSERSYRVRL